MLSYDIILTACLADQTNCRYPSFLFLFCKSGKVYILQGNLAGCIYILCILVVEDVAVLDGDIVYHTFCAMRHDSILAATYIDVADMNVLEIWQEFLFYRDCLLLGTYVVVK